tara:strand:- start:376 stop:1161 length:786 start_codon:yes stop_codon:yes gene_type:complete
MRIIFDYREKDITTICENIIEKEKLSDNITITTERLDIGDIIIKDDNDKELLIIERKSIKDLMSSIKDGRYKEQSLRLNSSDIHNHNIIYLIEGITSGYGYIEDPRVNINTIYSCMCSLMCYKGFSIIKSSNKIETSNIILKFADRINKDKNGFYYNLSTTSVNSNLKIDTELYSSTIKKVKSDNINIENIGEIMLSQIPKISANIAHEIMLKYKSIKNLLYCYGENNNLLEEFNYKNNKDQIKKLTKPAIENIKTYLFNN